MQGATGPQNKLKLKLRTKTKTTNVTPRNTEGILTFSDRTARCAKLPCKKKKKKHEGGGRGQSVLKSGKRTRLHCRPCVIIISEATAPTEIFLIMTSQLHLEPVKVFSRHPLVTFQTNL